MMTKTYDSISINNKKLKKSYQESYSLALHSNDLSTIKQLTTLGEPIPLSDEKMGISVISALFVMRENEEMKVFAPLLSYIFHNGIHNPKAKENEKSIILYNGFGFQIEEFIIDVLQTSTKEEINDLFPLEFCYYQLLDMDNKNNSNALKLWIEKGLPQTFYNEKLLSYSFQYKNDLLFSQFLNIYSDYIGAFLSHYSNFDSMNYWIIKTIEDNIWEPDEIAKKNLFYVDLTINLLKNCSDNLWQNTIEHLNHLSQLSGHNLPIQTFIDFINSNRLFMILENKIEDKIYKHKPKI